MKHCSSALVALAAVAVLALAAGAAAPAGAATSGVVSAYSFNSLSGGSVADSSGSGNTGKPSNATAATAGKYGGALSFNGSNSLVNVADTASLDLSKSMTLEAWVKPSALGTTWRTVVFKQQPGETVYSLYANQDRGKPTGQVYIGGEHGADGVSALPLGTWTHLADTYDGSVLKLYVNGTLVRSTLVTGGMPNSSGPLQIGGNGVWGEWFKGLIDEVRVYNRALSPGEIRTDMNTPIGSPPSPPPPADTQAPTMPTNVKAASSTTTSVSVSWSAATDDVGVVGYKLFRNGTQVSTSASAGYSFTGLACGTTYSLGVAAYDRAGNTGRTVSVSAATAVCAVSAPTPPTGSTANLWIDTNGGRCTRSATPVAWSDATACASMQAAYNAASAGDTINFSAGVYPGQVLGGGSKAVTFRGRSSAPAGYAVIRQLQTANDNLTLDGLDIDANKQMLSNGHALFENGGGDNDTVKNSRIGNVLDQKGALVDGDHFTFDNVVFHDVYQVTAGVHNECIYAIGVPNFVARDNTFTNCATMDLFFKYGSWWSPLPPAYGYVTLENNVFGHSANGTGWHYYGVYVGDTGPNGSTLMDHWTVRNNTFENDVMLGSSANGTRWEGNLGNWGCVAGIAYSHNLGAKCGTSDVAVSPASSCGPPACPTLRTAGFGWIDPARGDFHLAAGSLAINKADSADFPARDHDGIARPSGAAPDAGAYEYH